MLALGSRDMRSSICISLILLLGVAACDSAAQAPAPNSGQANEQAEEKKPELTRRALPTDTFKPSEKISEDFPVPFPVDI